MSWHFLQGQVAVSWDRYSTAGAPSALLKIMPTAEPSCCNGNATDCCQNFPSGMTSERLTGASGVTTSRLLPAASPVRTSPRLVPETAFPESVLRWYFRCSELLHRYGLDLFSQRILQTCVPMALAAFYNNLPAWGMMHAGACWEVGTSARHTGETECGYLPTPLARDYKSGKVSSRTLNKNARPLNEVFEAILDGAIPVPSKLLNGLSGGTWLAFREWLMGWPIGWTGLRPLAMAKFRQWLCLHGKY